MRATTGILAGSVTLLIGLLAAAGDRPEVPAATGMARIVEIAGGGDPDLMDVVFPAKLVEGREDWMDEDVLAWRAGFAAEIACAREIAVAREGDEAAATWTEPTGTKAVLLRFTGVRWVLDCAQSLFVDGAFLDRARGEQPARVALTARPVGGDYAASAFSFPYATGAPASSKNRMSIWFCGR